MSNLFSSGGAGNVGFSGETQQSLKFNDDESQYLSWTPAAAGNRKTFTLSMWFKLGNLPTSDHYLFGTGVSGSATQSWIYFNSSNSNKLTFGIRVSSSNYQITIDPLYRDPSAWYHLVYSVDTTQSTAADRVKIYVNGSQVTDFVSSSYPPQNSDTSISDAVPQVLGANNAGSGSFFDGYLSDIHFIDGQALDPTSFGQFTNGYWEKTDYSGTYGTNGFHLTFQDDVVSEGFNTVTYAGNGSTQSVSGLGFSPDLVWIKRRDGAAGHQLYDSVRGATKRLQSDSTGSESTQSTGLTSFDGDGFSLGSLGGSNNSNETFVAWAWDAGSGSAASNTDGSITSTVKANPDYGFSIVSYTGNGTAGATIGHGLSSAPEMIILKKRTATGNWITYHKDANASAENGYIALNLTSAWATNLASWNNTVPSSSVFTVGSGQDVNLNSAGFIGYCFNSVAGYSSIGSYSGTGSTVSVNTGFKAAWLLIKRTDTDGFSWVMLDNTRNPSGELDDFLLAENSIAETNNGTVKVLPTATGFDVTGTATSINASGGTYIYMAFADTREAAFWKDVSGQGNHWTPNNLDYRDSLIDSPANNFATWNSATQNLMNNGSRTLSEGNLVSQDNSTSYGLQSVGTFAVASGKWYWEINLISSTGGEASIGIEDANDIGGGNGKFYQTAGDVVPYAQNSSGTAYGATYTAGDIIGVALDLDGGTLTFYKNGTSQGTAATGLSGTFTPAVGDTSNSYQSKFAANFGQDSTFSGATTAGGNQDDNGIGDFSYPVPSGGYLALCTANLPTPTIIDGSDHFNTVLFTGDNADRNIDVGFKSDFVWLKHRNDASAHRLYDSLRGDGKALFSNLTNAEYNGVDDGVEFAYADGFNIDVGANVYSYNGSSQTYAAWNWKAGGTAVSNTAGSITSQVSANVDAGFSIVSYTGTGSSTTTGHGLNSAPELVIIKDRDSAQDWNVYHADVGTTNILALNLTSAAYADGAAMINSTAPTSSVVHIGFGGASNGSGRDYIAYCFHSVEGFSKVGSYTGNGSSDGPFVYTGFRPAFVIIKKTSGTAANWYSQDSKRPPYNFTDPWVLNLNLSNAEYQGDGTADNEGLNFYANGFKCHGGADHSTNGSGESYIYLAFAETPFKYANAR